jgi:hypothetical protein
MPVLAVADADECISRRRSSSRRCTCAGIAAICCRSENKKQSLAARSPLRNMAPRSEIHDHSEDTREDPESGASRAARAPRHPVAGSFRESSVERRMSNPLLARRKPLVQSSFSRWFWGGERFREHSIFFVHCDQSESSELPLNSVAKESRCSTYIRRLSFVELLKGLRAIITFGRGRPRDDGSTPRQRLC